MFFAGLGDEPKQVRIIICNDKVELISFKVIDSGLKCLTKAWQGISKKVTMDGSKILRQYIFAFFVNLFFCISDRSNVIKFLDRQK